MTGLVAGPMSIDVDERVTFAAMWESYQQRACRAALMVSSDPNVDDDVAARVAPLLDAVRDRLDRLWRDTFADLE